MTYFRYDDNKRGFDMVGIEWEIYATPTHVERRMGGGKYAAFSTIVEMNNTDEKYGAQITRNGIHVASLNQRDTSRFIRVITKDLLGRPKPIQSDVEFIEWYLSAGDAV